MTRCSLALCTLVAPGHAMHVDQAKGLTQTPEEWRDARVVELSGHVITASMLESTLEVQLWHHRDLGRDLAVGDLVRVHERLHALGWPYGWVNAQMLETRTLVREDVRPSSTRAP